MIRIFPKVAVSLLGWLIVADIAGVIICLLFDVAPLRRDSAALPYAIWLVLGIFAGMFAYNMAGAWEAPETKGNWWEQPGAARIGSRVLWMSVALLAGLGAFFHWLYWSRGVGDDYFVPDSAPHTIVFLVAVAVGMLVGRYALTSAD